MSTTKLRGATTEQIEDAGRAKGWHGSVDFAELPGRTHDDRSDYYWELDDLGVINGESGEMRDLYQCENCQQWFLPGDISFTEDDVELCRQDTGNGCFESTTNERNQS